MRLFDRFSNTALCLKKSPQHCERSELRLHFEWTKVNWKPEAGGQTVLPDKSVLIGQKLVRNAKTQES